MKKVLTKGRVSDIISRLSARRAVWSLKIEQQREKYKARALDTEMYNKVCEIQDLAILKENTTQNKSKTSKSSLVDWIVPGGTF